MKWHFFTRISAQSHLDVSNLHHDCLSDGFKAAEILKEALTLKPNAGGAIKEKMQKALKLIKDI